MTTTLTRPSVSTATAWAIYLRISRTDDRLGVDRQLDICRLQLAAMGIAESDIRIYDENNTSATKGLDVRTEYLRLLKDIKAGKVGGIMVFLQDRGWRDTDELSDFLKMNVRLATSSTGELDLTDPDTYANVKHSTVSAEREVRIISKRVKAASKQRAQLGMAHGRVGFGWRREVEIRGSRVVRSWDVLDDDEATVVRYAADQILRGKSLRAVALELNAGAVKPRPVRYKGATLNPVWDSNGIKKMLLRPSNAGLRLYQGQELDGVVNQAPAILDVETFRRLQSLLNDPARIVNGGGSTPRYLLSSLATCGLCGGRIRGKDDRERKGPGSRLYYFCAGRPDVKVFCSGQRHDVEHVDDYLAALIAERIADPAFAEADPDAQRLIDEQHAKIDRQRARLAEAQDAYAEELLPLAKLKTVKADVSDRIAEAEVEISNLRPQAEGFLYSGGEFALLDLEAKRAVVRQLFGKIELVPAASSPRDPELIADEVNYEWRGIAR